MADQQASSSEDGDDGATEVPRGLLRTLWSHPNTALERLMLTAVARLGGPSWRFAEHARQVHPAATPDQLTAGVQTQAVRLARIDGAIAGCPFLIALVPAYVAVLWEQARMALRIAALNHRDPQDPAMAAELLWLRGVHTSIEEAQAAVDAARLASSQRQRTHLGLSGWYGLGRRFLVLAGFLTPKEADAAKPPHWRQVLSLVVGVAIWALTWIVPVTFMLLMAYSCVTSTKILANRALSYYGHEGEQAAGQPPPEAPVARRTQLVRGAAITISVGVPLGALAVSAQAKPAGIHWYFVLAALLGLSLVLALGALSARRDPTPG